MAPVGLEHPPPLHPPPERREDGVEHRHPERQQGDKHQGAHLAFHRSHDRQRGNRIAQEVAPAVAQEDARRVEVVAQEPQDRPAQRREIHRVEIVSRHDRQDDHQQAREEHHPTRQAIQAVDQVDRIDEQEKPEDRDRIAQDAELDAVPAEEDAADRDPAGKSERRPRDLEKQLDPRIQPPEVVPQPAAEDDQRPIEAERRPVIEGEERGNIRDEQIRQRHRSHEGEKHSQPSEPRNRCRVDLPLHRNIHGTQAHPCPLRRRRKN